MTSPTVPVPGLGAPRARTSVLVVITAGLYAVLFLVMWVPMWFGNMGWGYLYPVFLLLWLPLEVLAIVALVIESYDVIRRLRARLPVAGLAWAALGGAFVLALLSLPTLWFGTLPWFVFLPF